MNPTPGRSHDRSHETNHELFQALKIMALANEKLRILAFPQRIDGDQLDLNVLLLPTQRLLNVEASYNSRLNPGTTVQLPKFISAELKLEVKTIQGLATYPFSDVTVLTN